MTCYCDGGGAIAHEPSQRCTGEPGTTRWDAILVADGLLRWCQANQLALTRTELELLAAVALRIRTGV